MFYIFGASNMQRGTESDGVLVGEFCVAEVKQHGQQYQLPGGVVWCGGGGRDAGSYSPNISLGTPAK